MARAAVAFWAGACEFKYLVQCNIDNETDRW